MPQSSNEVSRSSPCELLGLSPSFGFGDRIGLATPGHVEAMRRVGEKAGIQAIFPQQSIREMTRTGRTPRQVMNDALQGLRDAGWRGRTGADADHLKTEADIDATSAVGFTFFTIDPSELVDPKADDYEEPALRGRYQAIADEVLWVEEYRGRSLRLDNGTSVELTEEACLRAAVKYGRALNLAIRLGRHIAEVSENAGRPYEIELSVDETEQPTTLAEHYLIASRCLEGGLKLISLAPRFIGELEKGVDYKGNLEALERSMADHAAIASMLGPYKLSLHSGSDKLSMYEVLARTTRGRFHVKTAGTSYLEALRVVARHDPGLFRRIIQFARGCYERDRATYHVSATLQSVPPPSDPTDPVALERTYLECWSEASPGKGFTQPGRQILHCTFGSTLLDPELGPAIRDVLSRHPETYQEVLADHFSRHLEALRAGL